MKIKRLELCGFKSFVDRTTVNFNHSVMGVVGPNGCGKSNIVDAIRWCMGEQSAKHLRGKNMEDVIFSGSESRTGADYAEVTLTFENDDPTDMPLEYKEYAELAVTRRLHRSGDSEYLINKTPVRLKDITDLFLGTGVGTKAYSIVEQGKIGLIVSAKPEDRRLLIEEAAGITKFKSRKKQAERKMELTQQNLLRVGDIIAEIERNLGSLQRQAAKAERYMTYRSELEELQLYDASHKFLELRGWIAREQGEVDLLTLEATERKTELGSGEAQLESIRSLAQEAEERLEHAHTRAAACESDVREEQTAIERACVKIATLKERAGQAEHDLYEIEEQTRALCTEQATIAEETAGLEGGEAGLSCVLAEEEAALADRGDELRNVEQEGSRLRDALAAAQTSIATTEAKIDGLARRNEELLARGDKLSWERQERERSAAETETSAAQLTDRVAQLVATKAAATTEKVELDAQLGTLKDAIGESERALESAKHEASAKRSRLRALTELHARREGVGKGAKALMEAGDAAVRGIVGDRVEAPPELNAALAAVLAAHVETVVVGELDRGLDLLSGLSLDQRGRATVVAHRPPYVSGGGVAGGGVAGGGAEVTSVANGAMRLVDHLRYAEEDEGLIRSLLGEVLCVPTIEQALTLRCAGVNATVVSIDGTVFHRDGRISGGTGEEAAAHRLEVNREMRELQTEVHALDQLVSTRLHEYERLRAQMTGVHGALERARNEAHQSELALVRAEKDLLAAQTNLQTHRHRLGALGGEIEEVTRALAELEQTRSECLAFLQTAKDECEGLRERLAWADLAAEDGRVRVRAQQERVVEQRVIVAQAREKLTATRATLQRLSRSAVELSERARRLEGELALGAEELGRTAAVLYKHREVCVEAQGRFEQAQREVAVAKASFEELRGELTRVEAGLRSIRSQAEAAREMLTHHEMALRERQLAMDHLLGSIREKFRGLHLPRVVGDFHMRAPPDRQLGARIDELGQLIERMGAVNLDAVREHEEAEKRYAFYTSQKSDIDKALADLDQAIAQMNRESRKLFEATFEAVNARFQEVFPKMFRGGRAELRLTAPNDMLETGIDIIAQPPGKKISSIELMSGGEKALTAVSLIFAIFQIKPSPFCVLDEVDAPLDEANVGRYCDLIREMTDRSQFILITHIKKTMQMVDVLHGVTMGEPGVSRLVSVKVSETGRGVKSAGAVDGDADADADADAVEAAVA